MMTKQQFTNITFVRYTICMKTPIYICKGTCQAEITQEQYDQGITQCGATECTLHGHPFTKMEKDTDSGDITPIEDNNQQ